MDRIDWGYSELSSSRNSYWRKEEIVDDETIAVLPNQRTVFTVHPISSCITSQEISKIFSEYGKLEQIELKGLYGFLTFAEDVKAHAAQQDLHEFLLDEYPVKGEIYTPLRSAIISDDPVLFSLPSKVSTNHYSKKGQKTFHTEIKREEDRNETRQRRRVKMKQASRNLYQQPCTYDPNRLSLVNPDIYEELSFNVDESNVFIPSDKKNFPFPLYKKNSEWSFAQNTSKKVAEVSIAGISRSFLGYPYKKMAFVEVQAQIGSLSSMCIKVVCKLISEKPRKLEGLPQDILSVLLVNSVINDNTLFSLTTSNLRELQLMCRAGDEGLQSLLEVGNSCPNLQKLELSVVGLQPRILLHILNQCEQLKLITLSSFDDMNLSICEALGRLPNLEQFTATQISQIADISLVLRSTSLRNLYIEGCTIAKGLVCSTTLTSLRIRELESSEISIHIDCPNLTTLSINTLASNEDMIKIFQISSGLTEVFLHHCPNINDLNIFSYCKNLVRLEIGETGLKGDTLDSIQIYCPKLVVLQACLTLSIFSKTSAETLTLGNSIQMPQLKHFKAVLSKFTAETEPIKMNFPVLEECDLNSSNGSQALPSWVLHEAFQGMQFIRKLHLNGNFALNLNHFYQFSPKSLVRLVTLNQLEDFSLSNASLTDVSDLFLAFILNISPNLRRFSLTGVSTSIFETYPSFASLTPDLTRAPSPLVNSKEQIDPVLSSLLREPEAISAMELSELSLSVSASVSTDYVSKVLAHCKMLEYVSLEGFRNELPKLECPSARTLYLRENMFTRTLTVNCPLIEELDIHGNQINDSLHVLNEISRGCPALTSLNLEIPSPGVPPLNFPELLQLRVVCTTFQDSDLVNISFGCGKLRRLVLASNGRSMSAWNLNPQPVNHINPVRSFEDTSSIRLSHLSEVDLSSSNITDNALGSLVIASNALRKLNLRRCASLVSPSILSPTVREISLENCATLQNLVLDCPKLVSLDLSSASVTEDMIEDIGRSCPSLTYLYLNKCSTLTSLKINSSSIVHLELKANDSLDNLTLSCSELRELYMDSNRIKDDTLSSILANNPQLEFLDISRSQYLLNPVFSSSLNLREVQMPSCFIVESISIVESCPKLENFSAVYCENLRDIRVISSSIRNLSLDSCFQLKTTDLKCPNLHTISLKDCGNMEQTKIQECFQLQEIDLTKSNISTDFIHSLNTSNNMLRKLTLRSCTNLFAAHFETSNQYLQVIHLDDCGKLYDLSFQCPNLKVLLIERCSKVESLVIKCPILETFNMKDCINLQSFSVYSDLLKQLHFPPTCEDLVAPTIRCKNLNFLNLESAPLTDSALSDILINNPNICYLYLKNLSRVTELSKRPNFVSKMESLYCRNMSRLTSVQLEPSETLRFVNFSGCCKLKKILVQPRYESLWALKLAETNIRDEFAVKIQENFPNLRILNLSNTEVSEKGLSGLHKLIHLRILSLATCYKITQLDIQHETLLNLDLSDCYQLKSLSFACPSLLSLNLSHNTLSLQTLENVSSGCSALKYVWMRKCLFAKSTSLKLKFAELIILDISHCTLSNELFSAFVTNSPNLESFNFSFVKGVAFIQIESKKLKTVNGNNVRELSEIMISSTSVKNVNLQGCDQLVTVKIESPTLQLLSANECEKLHSAVLDCPHLSELHIVNTCLTASKLTDAIQSQLINLKFLDISNCSKISTTRLIRNISSKIQIKQDKSRRRASSPTRESPSRWSRSPSP